ncbi:MAG: hypothetical protein GY856_27080 [bacterium]|nr:hypothetical protein [bacterium]
MRRILVPICLLWLAGAAPDPATGQVEVRTIHQRFLLGDAAKIDVDLSLGDLTIEAADGDSVEVDLRFECVREDLERCRQRAEKIRLVPRVRGRVFHVRLAKTPKGRAQGIKAAMSLRIPPRVELEVDIRGGDVFVTGMRSDLEIDGLVGNVDVIAGRDRTASVKVDVGAGKAELWLGDGRIEGTGFPRSLTWKGSGTSKIEVDLGSGNVRVRLE